MSASMSIKNMSIKIEGGLILGVAALVGSQIMPSVGAIEGIALIGIATAMTLPLSYCFSKGLEKWTSLRGIKSIGCEAFVSLVFYFTLIAAAHAICHATPSLAPFSMGEAYSFAGYHFGVSLGFAAGLGCLGGSSLIAAGRSGAGASRSEGRRG